MTNERYTQAWYEEFVEVWQQMDSADKVAAHFTITKFIAQDVARNLRKKGVDLKVHENVGLINFDRLRKIVGRDG